MRLRSKFSNGRLEARLGTRVKYLEIVVKVMNSKGNSKSDKEKNNNSELR